MHAHAHTRTHTQTHAQAHTCVHHGQAATADRSHGAAAIALSDGALHSDGVWELLLQSNMALMINNNSSGSNKPKLWVFHLVSRHCPLRIESSHTNNTGVKMSVKSGVSRQEFQDRSVKTLFSDGCQHGTLSSKQHRTACSIKGTKFWVLHIRLKLLSVSSG